MSTLMRLQPLMLRWISAIVLITVAYSAARADGVNAPAQRNEAHARECSACHLAYAPALLPAPSWQRLMDGLSRHFGSDASLDPASRQQITAWLVAHAGDERRWRARPPEDRITLSPWFVREHREVSAAVWKRPAVGGPGQCAACHRGAEQGVFDEDDVRIPR
jgi:hypothetical protein